MQQFASKGLKSTSLLEIKEEFLECLPIHFACEGGHLDIVQYLLELARDDSNSSSSESGGGVVYSPPTWLNARDANGVRPLHLAAIGGHVSVLRLLLRNNADAHALDDEGDSPLQWASTRADVQPIVLLAEAAPRTVRQANRRGWVPLHRAAMMGRRAVVEMLVTRFAADVNVPTADAIANTPAHLAAGANQLGALEALLRLGADAKMANAKGRLPYHMCLSEGGRDLVAQYGGAVPDPEHAPSPPPPPPLHSGRGRAVEGNPSYEQGSDSSSISHRISHGAVVNGGSSNSMTNENRISKGDRISNSGRGRQDSDRSEETITFSPAAFSKSGSSNSLPVTTPESPLSARRSMNRIVAGSPTAPLPSASSHALSPSLLPTPLPRIPPIAPSAPAAAAATPTGLPPPPIPSSSDYQDRIRDENRRALAAAAVGLSPSIASLNDLTNGSTVNGHLNGPVRASFNPSTGGRNLSASLALLNGSGSSAAAAASDGGEAQQVLRRPVSANKKFLAKYNLDRLNLFAP
eukprot:CAMPEP_0175040754 /NCGR_PEP_ID=MMETSP0052_2-20121109/1464_1 /TAXON_ID=51329 ORGANISM="Polytomella parva, Strain SAG 63-3" /NCGR_SAMPLE_ID=MMETSP0052_2 /ASSEMBLY_ACC=CAM_ASM_000194 /LENGTH=520 /DNA_ID=CAMNT_0016303051 /DNA_START=235 /DNA_END=1797 /DNA_ORIENTATION=+